MVVGLDVRPSCSRLVVEEAPSIEIHYQSHHSMVLLLFLVVVVFGIDEVDSRIDDGLQQHPSHRERHRTNDNQSINRCDGPNHVPLNHQHDIQAIQEYRGAS